MSEQILARRMRVEREARGWSFSAMARAMTDAGAPMPPNAVSRIESGERRIQFDEVVALMRVLGTDIVNVATDVDVLNAQDLRERAAEIEDTMAELREAAGVLVRSTRDLWAAAFRAGRDGQLVTDVLQRVLEGQRQRPTPTDDGDQVADGLTGHYLQELLGAGFALAYMGAHDGEVPAEALHRAGESDWEGQRWDEVAKLVEGVSRGQR